MKKEEFADRLSCACASVISAEQELTEIDSFRRRRSWPYHEKIAGAIDSAVKGLDGGIKEMLDDAAMAVMVLNGGSAVPWNAWLDGMQEDAPRETRSMFLASRRSLNGPLRSWMAYLGQRSETRPWMDALDPASEAIAAYEGDEMSCLPLPPKQRAGGAEASRQFVSRFGRPKAMGPRPSELPTRAQYPWRISSAAWPGLKCNGIH
ncbi:MAG: hypothetical protein ACLU8D_03010 [Enterocloster sp.]